MSDERPASSRRGYGFWVRVLGVLALFVWNCLNVARQGVEHWWAAIVNNGNLQIVWDRGERPPGVSIQANTEDGNGVGFDPDEKVSLAAGRYAIKVMQFDRQLPVTLLSPAGEEIHYAQVARFRTETVRIKSTPTNLVFSGVYDLVADGLGRPKSSSRRLHRVYQGFHQNGTMLWFYDTNTFLILRASDGTWTEVQGAPYPKDPCLYNLDCVDARVHPHPPKGMHTSVGGGYQVWNAFKMDLGWMTGYCIYWDAVIREDFERGFLIGPLRAAPFGETSVGFGLFSDKGRNLWRQPTLFGVKPAECKAGN